MSTLATRRAFLRGRGNGALAVRPPWARSEALFLDRCERLDGCTKCRKACPEGIIVRGDGGYPELDFKAGLCTFCGDCAKACPVDALDAAGPAAEAAPWGEQPVLARIDEAGCLSLQGVTCRSCGDVCAPGALKFRLMTAGRARPTVDDEICTGCGACVRPCPVGVVSATPIDRS